MMQLRRTARLLALLALALFSVACGSDGSTPTAAAETSVDTETVDTDEAVTATTRSEPVADELLSEAGEPVSPGEEPSTDDEEAAAENEPPTFADIGEANARLGRGINIGNSLEAPREGAWGVGIEAEYFDIIASAGFDHVRLPISWAGYADTEAPFTIPDGSDPTIDHPDYSSIWERVDWAIEQAEASGLLIIVNMHHYDEIHADPRAEEDRFLAMWEQISTRYAGVGDHVFFELLNEPNNVFDAEPEIWNDLAAKSLAIVREDHPTRPVLIGPVGYNSIGRLAELDLPDDPNIIATVHVYEPFDFTHQGATWIDPVRPLGAAWVANEPGLPLGVYNYSWDTNTEPVDGQLRVSYERQWAGFSLDFEGAVGPTSASLTLAGAAELRVLCRTPDGELEITTLTTSDDRADYEVDLSSCPQTATGVSLQTAGSGAPQLLIDSFVICTDARGCEEMVVTAGGALDGLLEQAAAWAEAQGVPMHMGEFGAFGAEGQVPIADRAQWTATAAGAATTRGMSFAYWEFHAGFGAYDLDANDWVPELRDALVG